MKKGRIIEYGKWDILKFRLKMDVINNGDGTNYMMTSKLINYSTPNSNLISRDMSLRINHYSNMEGVKRNTYSVYLFGDEFTIDSESDYHPEIYLEIKDFRVYVNERENGLLNWIIKCGDVNFYYPGGSQEMNGNFSVSSPVNDTDYLVPSSIPLMGISSLLYNDEILNYNLDPITISGTYQYISEGGWSYKMNDEWYELPTTIDVHYPQLPACCPFELEQPIIECTDTNHMKLQNKKTVETVFTCLVFEENIRGIYALSIPNNDKKILKCDNYLCEWDVREFPQVNTIVMYYCFNDCDEPLCNTSGSYHIENYPHKDRTIVVVTNSTNEVENRFTTVNVPYSYVTNRLESPLAGSVSPPAIPCVYKCIKSSGVLIDFPNNTDNNINDYFLSFADYDVVNEVFINKALVNYYNSWANPHWHFFYNFEDWKLGVPLQNTSRANYYIPNRTQFIEE